MAYTGPSIVDYLKSVGQQSDYGYRSQLAQQYGISNYIGSAAQNTQLLNLLRSGGQQEQKTKDDALIADTTGAPKPPMYEPEIPQENLGIQNEIDKNRRALEESYQKELERIRMDKEEAERKEKEWKSKQEMTLEEQRPLTSPFREDLEKTERKRLKVEENFFKNQELTDELDKLLTESNELARKLATQKVPGLGGIPQSERMIKTYENVQGRVSVVNAVMSARNNQIGTALNFIDRSVNAITQDRQDRLNYLQNLSNWYETMRTEEGAKVFQLSRDEKEMINKQIGLLEDDLNRAQQVSDGIKQIMLEDPDLAAESGISLGDTMEEITQKLSQATYYREINGEKDEMGKAGYEQITAQEAAQKPQQEVLTRTDSRGNTRYYWQPTPPEKVSGGTGGVVGFSQWAANKGLVGMPQAWANDLLSPMVKNPPDWFRYKMQEELQQTLLPSALQEMWDEAKKLTKGEDFTPTEKRKLEQAGLLDAPRMEQLDYLYKKFDDFDDL